MLQHVFDSIANVRVTLFGLAVQVVNLLMYFAVRFAVVSVKVADHFGMPTVRTQPQSNNSANRGNPSANSYSNKVVLIHAQIIHYSRRRFLG
jgi:hypothetical protein